VQGAKLMMQLVVWIVIATVNPASLRAKDHDFHGQRFVAAYTTEAECQKHARFVNADQQLAFAAHPEDIFENYACRQVVVQTECRLTADGRC
jgi:hypothetical protein